MARLTPETERFLRKAVAGLPFQKRREARDELRAHLEDAIEQQVAQGTKRGLAEKQALAALGPAEVLNRELLRAHYGKKWLLHYLFQKLGWWMPELPHIRFRPKFIIWKHTSKYSHQYAEGRYDEIIPRLERELASRGPNDDIHHELGLAYNAIRDYERALTHLQAAVDWRKAHPEPRSSSDQQDIGLGCAYSNLAGVLESLGRHEEAEAAVRAGLVVNGKNFMLICQQAEYLIERDDLDEAFQHLDVSLKDSAPVFDHGKSLLHFLSTDRFDPVRKDPRFGGLVQRAYGELAGMVEPLAGDAEVEAALRDSLAGDGEGFLEHCRQAKHCLESGDFDGTFDHLEASLNDGGRVADSGKLLLFVLCAHEFDLLRKDPRFGHLLLNASHHSKH